MAGWESGVDTCNGLRIEPSDPRDVIIMQKTANDLSLVNWDVNPEGFVSANKGSVCVDRVTGNLYQKLIGTGNTGWSSPINKQMVYYISGQIDFTQAGVVDLFTIAGGGTFVPMIVGVVMTTVTNFSGSAQADIGYNAPDYDNMFDGWQEFANATNFAYWQDSLLPGAVVPAGSNVKMNITVPEVADVATGRIFYMGITI